MNRRNNIFTNPSKMLPLFQRSGTFSWVDATFFLFVASLPLEQLLANYFGIDFSPTRIVAIVLVITCYISLRKRNSLPIPAIVLLAIFPIVVAIAHVVTSGTLEGYANAQSMVLNILILIAVRKYSIDRWLRAKQGVLLFGLVIHFVSIVTIIINGISILSASERLNYMELDPNGIGLWAAMGVVVSILFLGDSTIQVRVKSILMAGSLASVIVIIASGSRTAFIVPILSVVVFYAMSRQRSLSLGKAVLLGIFVLFSYWALQQGDVAQDRWQRTFNAEAINKYGNRDIVAAAAVAVILERPLVGWGEANGLRELGQSLGFRRFGTHNSYMYMLVVTGALGAIPFLVFSLIPVIQWVRYRVYWDFSLIATLLVFDLIAFGSLDWHFSKHHWMLYGMFLAFVVLLRRQGKLFPVSAQVYWRPSRQV